MAGGARLLVPFNRSPASLRGLDIAFRIARGEKDAHIRVIYVVEVNRRLNLDAELPANIEAGGRCIAEAEKLARKWKLRCEGDILQAREAGHAIVDEVVTLGSTAVVLGVSRRGGVGAAVDHGRTAEYILRHAPCEVILVQCEEPV